MRDDSFPHLVSDPEAEGIPGYADDDSVADNEGESGRIADGPDPAPLPGDRPLAVDSYGTTAREARLGEPLDLKLAREEPDPALAGADGFQPDLVDPPAGQPDGAFDPDPLDDSLDDLDPGTAEVFAGVEVDPAVGSAVSVHDSAGFDEPGGLAPVGRLVEPDQGGPVDAESDAVAYDAGAAGGGASAEELAIHRVPD